MKESDVYSKLLEYNKIDPEHASLIMYQYIQGKKTIELEKLIPFTLQLIKDLIDSEVYNE